MRYQGLNCALIAAEFGRKTVEIVMDFRQLRYFTAIADYGSFSEAAARLWSRSLASFCSTDTRAASI
jgi:hypothetical protein